jgi:hypothetical protein
VLDPKQLCASFDLGTGLDTVMGIKPHRRGACLRLKTAQNPTERHAMHTAYCFALDLPQALPAALTTLRAALAAEQMGIVSEVDVQATLKNKLGLESHPQRLLGVCAPQIAHALLSAEPDIAALLPCGCGLSKPPPGHTRGGAGSRVIAAQCQPRSALRVNWPVPRLPRGQPLAEATLQHAA